MNLKRISRPNFSPEARTEMSKLRKLLREEHDKFLRTRHRIKELLRLYHDGDRAALLEYLENM